MPRLKSGCCWALARTWWCSPYSRIPFRLYGEREYPVPPLGLPPVNTHLSPDDVSGSSAVALFVERVRASQPDFVVTSANVDAIAAICHRLDSLRWYQQTGQMLLIVQCIEGLAGIAARIHQPHDAVQLLGTPLVARPATGWGSATNLAFPYPHTSSGTFPVGTGDVSLSGWFRAAIMRV